MKMPNQKNWLVSRVALVVSLVAFTATWASAQVNRIDTRPLTHQEIHDYALPEGTQPSGGLPNVGVGEAVYLEALVLMGTPVTDIVWNLSTKPPGSTATLATSPLGPEIPIYGSRDQLEYDIAGRQLLIPDLRGLFILSVTVTTNGGGSFILNKTISVGSYAGVGTIDGGIPSFQKGQCGTCHAGDGDQKVTTWASTGHATMFTEAIDGLKSSHYNSDCIQCHVLGYNTNALANNGGFDDVAATNGWTFPAVLEPGNWASISNDLKQVSNIQCENCHGPGSDHFGSPMRTAVSFNSGTCAQCHDEQPYHVKNIEWNNSKHAIAVREERTSCAGCHQGIGFVDRVDGISPVRTEYAPITCAACHDPHGSGLPHQIRTLADVTLNDSSAAGGNTVITEGGNGKLCMQCHISRRDAVSYAEEYHDHYGPHSGPQTDMFVGKNAITYGKNIPSSTHHRAIAESCVHCHIQGVANDHPAFGKAGGHTFEPSWDNDTPDDPSDDIDLVGSCAGCHGPITSFDFGYRDYDGDGVVEGVQSEVTGLLHDLGMKLPPLGDPTVEVTTNYTSAELKAAYNYFFVEEDGSLGVHNTAFAVGLLKASLEDLDPDFDKDGLLDSWEITYFGSIEAYDGNGDPDGDLAKNSVEQASMTLPNVADSDGDSFNDYAELQAGTDPNDPESNPDLVVYVYLGAAEIEFPSEIGKTYQIQSVSELDTAWQDEGDPIDGTGDMIKRQYSTRTETERFFRVVELP